MHTSGRGRLQLLQHQGRLLLPEQRVCVFSETASSVVTYYVQMLLPSLLLEFTVPSSTRHLTTLS
jgi:hypothetical protein